MKLFHSSYNILNASSEKIMFLWNFCHLCPVLFCDWNTSINDSFGFFCIFFFFFLHQILEGGFTFYWGWCLFFSWEGSFIFKWGLPYGVTLVLMGGRGWGLGKSQRIGGSGAPPCTPTMGNPGSQVQPST